jgi:prophage antirepressor-like protein
MSKKDYELIARVVATIIDDETRWAVATAFAKALKRENNSFRIDTFLEACKRGHQKKPILSTYRELLR